MRIAETGRCLTLAGLQGVRKIFGPIDPAHPLTSAPCDSFDKAWITDDVRFASQAFGRLIPTQIAGCGRDTGFLHPFLGCILHAHGPAASRLGSYPDKSSSYDGLRKIGVLGKETRARMNCFRPASLCRSEERRVGHRCVS